MSDKKREILFRGKENPSGKWIEGFLVGNCHIGDWVTATPVHSNTVGQFIGLTDKNGKKVFEGDIVKIKDYSGGCYLTCEQPTSKWVVKWYEKEARFGIDYMQLFPYDFTKSEVIGNIHDNPELLKRGANG